MERLVADKMLAKLSRWLRLCGVSVQGAPYADDLKIIRFMKRNGGILLTMDVGLAQRSRKRAFKALLITEKTLDGQLAYVSAQLGLRIRPKMGICTVCNSKLAKVDKRSVQGKVPLAVLKKHRTFYLCKNCGRVYWLGSHWSRIKDRIRRIGMRNRTIS